MKKVLSLISLLLLLSSALAAKDENTPDVDMKDLFEHFFSIPRILCDLKDALVNPPEGQPKNFACHRLDLGFDIGHCSICANATELKAEGDELRFCGSITFGCAAGSLGFNTTFDAGCFDIQDCKLFGCPNNCSQRGTCDAFGYCTCQPGYAGPDCSVVIDSSTSCISSDFFGKTCWKTYFPDCRTVMFAVIRGGNAIMNVTSPIADNKPLTLMPPAAMEGFDVCQMSVVASNTTVKNDTLIGCPTLSVSCEGVHLKDFPFECMTLAKSSKLICPDTPVPTPTDADNSGRMSTARVVMWVAVGGVVIALLVAGGYFVFSRFIRKSNESLYGYDVVSLNPGIDDDDDFAPLKSPFAGSSDDE